MSNKDACRLVIATRDEDREALQSEPTFRMAKTIIPIEHIVYNLNAPQSREQIMRAMSAGHKLLADRMFNDRAKGVFIYPDIVLADGAIKRVEALARTGVKVVLCLAVPSPTKD